MNPLCFSLVVPEGDAARQRVAQIAEAGFDGLEPTFGASGTLPSVANPIPAAEALRKLTDAAGIKIPSMRGGPTFWPNFGSGDKAKRDMAVATAGHAIDAVKAMGGDVLLIVPGQWDAGQTYAAMWANALDTAKRIAEVAEKKQFTVALENVENRFLLSPNDWVAFLDQVGSPRVRMYFDAGNIVRNCQGHPQQWLRQLGKSYIRRVHFKDAQEGGAVMHLLAGTVDWTAVTQALRAIGYDDWVGVELDIPNHQPGAMLKNMCAAARAILNPIEA